MKIQTQWFLAYVEAEYGHQIKQACLLQLPTSDTVEDTCALAILNSVQLAQQIPQPSPSLIRLTSRNVEVDFDFSSLNLGFANPHDITDGFPNDGNSPLKTDVEASLREARQLWVLD